MKKLTFCTSDFIHVSKINPANIIKVLILKIIENKLLLLLLGSADNNLVNNIGGPENRVSQKLFQVL